MDLENPDHTPDDAKAQLVIRLPSAKVLEDAYHKRKRTIMIKINQKAYRVASKLASLQKKLPASNELYSFIKSELLIEDKTKYSFINQDISLPDFQANMRFLYKMSRKIQLLVESLVSGALVKHKILKFLAKALQKLCQIFSTYFHFVEDAAGAGFVLTHFESEELSSFGKRLRAKIEGQASEAVAPEVEQRRENIIKIPSRQALSQSSAPAPTPWPKFKFDKKDLGLSNELKKIREEAEKLNFNDFENRKQQFKDQLRDFETEVQYSLQHLLHSTPAEPSPPEGLNYSKIQNAMPAKKPGLIITLPKPHLAASDKKHDPQAKEGPYEDEVAALSSKAKFIQAFWRFLQHKRKLKKIVDIRVSSAFIRNPNNGNSAKTHTVYKFDSAQALAKETSRALETGEDPFDDEDQSTALELAKQFENKIKGLNDQRTNDPPAKSAAMEPPPPGVTYIEAPINVQQLLLSLLY